ncbi:hypothetical protein MTR67_053533 [Solanum verrucosum]|uniref:Uncharacterized protein n=1 Tax=Solanum verrucosum TaxID=315347 RepID=A0AAF0VAY9_SOLVR|nr:hypothetical protein MTR67_053533 [Solanum verrucosum]
MRRIASSNCSDRGTSLQNRQSIE